MKAELIKWIPATPRHRAYGFAKPEVGERDVLVFASDIVEGVPYIGAKLEIRTRKTHIGGNNRLQAYDVRVIV
ncbi:hypothetical protein [Bradyrhizobium sp.]|uniref:hypothetical protein n=1 Tax=Bradyrhizobium sp. TaxID=376 RepID=UPI0026228EB1|nr:hypothetical protein [Bradyrhizobium sp.]